MRRVTLITLFVVGLMLMIHVEALSKEASDLPLLIDLSQLELKVTDAKVVDHISTGTGGFYDEKTTLSAKKGYKLVVVSLEGRVQKPGRLTLDTTDFSAVYEEETINYNGQKRFQVFLQKSGAVAKDSRWIIPPKGASGNFTTYYIYKPGPFTLWVAFVLSEEITSFYLRYPTFAQGKVLIPGKQDDDSRK